MTEAEGNTLRDYWGQKETERLIAARSKSDKHEYMAALVEAQAHKGGYLEALQNPPKKNHHIVAKVFLGIGLVGLTIELVLWATTGYFDPGIILTIFLWIGLPILFIFEAIPGIRFNKER